MTGFTRIWKKSRHRSMPPIVWALFTGTALNGFSTSIVTPFISIYLYAYEDSPVALIGLVVFLQTISNAVMQLAGGELCDRFGRKPVFMAGLAGVSMSFTGLAVGVASHASFEYFLALLILSGISSGLFSTAPSAVLADEVGEEQRAEAYSTLRTGYNLGYSIGPMIGGIAASVSYALAFSLTAIASAAYLVIVTLYVRERNHGAAPYLDDRSQHISLLEDRPFTLLLVLAFLAALVAAHMYSPLSVYAKGIAGLSEKEIGAFLSLNGLMVVFLQFPVTRVSGRIRLTTSMALGMGLYAIGLALIAIQGGFEWLMLCVAVMIFGELLYLPSLTTLTANMSPKHRRGRYFGLVGLAGSAGFGVGALLGGWLLGLFWESSGVFWLIAAMISLVCGASFWYLGVMTHPKTSVGGRASSL